MSRSYYRIAAVAAAGLLLAGCGRGVLAPQWGVTEGRLTPCTGLRGCVSSHAAEAVHYVEPYAYTSTRSEARADLLSILRAYADAQIVSMHPGYIRVEVASRDGGPSDAPAYHGEITIDIIEFYLPVDEQAVQVRAAPRRQMPDSGENRNRIEMIRTRFNELQARR